MNSPKSTGSARKNPSGRTCGVLGTVAALAAFLLGTVPIRGAVSPDSGHDLMLTVLARRALLDDRELADLNLGVLVHHRVAILWGPVPSPVLAQRAVRVLAHMPELVQVRNELHLAPEIGALPPPRPALEPAWLPGLSPGKLTTHVQEKPARRVAEAAWQAVRPAQDPRMPDHREFEVVLPSLRLPTPSLSDPAAAALDRALEKSIHDLRHNLRFAAIDVRIKDGMVTLTGDPAPALYDFAHVVSHLPGAKRVVVKEK